MAFPMTVVSTATSVMFRSSMTSLSLDENDRYRREGVHRVGRAARVKTLLPSKSCACWPSVPVSRAFPMNTRPACNGSSAKGADSAGIPMAACLRLSHMMQGDLPGRGGLCDRLDGLIGLLTCRQDEGRSVC